MNTQINLTFFRIGPASVDSSSPPAPSAAAPPTAPTIVAPIIAQAPPIQPSVVTTAAFAHLNNGYLDVTPPRNAYVSVYLVLF